MFKANSIEYTRILIFENISVLNYYIYLHEQYKLNSIVKTEALSIYNSV